jgi:hypothetical protein
VRDIFLDPFKGVALVLKAKVQQSSLFHFLGSAETKIVQTILYRCHNNWLAHGNTSLDDVPIREKDVHYIDAQMKNIDFLV